MEKNIDITIFTSPSCPRCKILKTKMDLKKIAYVERNDIETLENLGIQQLPVVLIDGQYMDFKQANDYINNL